MKVRVLFFAYLRDRFGVGERVIEIQEGSLMRDLINHLKLSFPERETVRFAVNEEFSGEDRRLEKDDVIALLPPVSGG